MKCLVVPHHHYPIMIVLVDCQCHLIMGSHLDCLLMSWVLKHQLGKCCCHDMIVLSYEELMVVVQHKQTMDCSCCVLIFWFL